MFTKDKVELIAQYERLRCELRELDSRIEQVDRELIEMEKRLPKDYVYPDNPPVASTTCCRNGVAGG